MKFFLKNPLELCCFIFDNSRINRYEWLLISILTVSLTLFFHANALTGYWRFDDGAHLMFATEFSPWQYFFDPVITRAQSGASVTPWNVYFYDLNLSIFGFEPCGFYAHLLFLLMCTTLALYALLRLWLPLPSATLGIIVFLAGKPTYHMAQELMSNHYLTGMLFSLLSLNFFIRYIRHGNTIKLITAVIFYALAMTCKEVYVPMILLLFVLPAGYFKQRVQAILPFVFTAICYTLWRHQVLGTFVGGYTTNTGELNPLNVVQQFLNIPFLLFDTHSWGLAGFIILVIMSLLALSNRVLNIPLLIVCTIILLSPLIPLTLYPGIHQPDRYLFALWTAISFWIAILFQPNESNRNSVFFSQTIFVFKLFGGLILIIACFIGIKNEQQRYKNIVDKAESIYHFAIESDFSQKALMLSAKDRYWILVSSEARRAYDISKNLNPAPVVIFSKTLDGLLLLDQVAQEQQLELASIQFYQYRNGFFNHTKLAPFINTSLKSLNDGKNQILQITFSQEKEILTWEFQPKELTYSATLRQDKSGRARYSIVNMPQSGSFPINLLDDTQISLSFKAAKGWVAVSPTFNLESRPQTLEWRGKTSLTPITSKLQSLLARIGD